MACEILLLTFRIGSKEITLLRAFIRAARISLWSGRPEGPGIVKNCKTIFERYLRRRRRGKSTIDDDDTFEDGLDTDVDDAENDDAEIDDAEIGDEQMDDVEMDDEQMDGVEMDDGPQDNQTREEGSAQEQSEQEKQLLNRSREQLLARGIKLPARYSMQGRVYSAVEKHPGNSQVMFVRPNSKDGSQKLIPGHIKYICKLRDQSYQFVVQALQLPSANTVDPFARYLAFPGRLWSNDLSDEELVDPRNVRGHFASCSWPRSDTLTVVIPLTPVSSPVIGTILSILNFECRHPLHNG